MSLPLLWNNTLIGHRMLYLTCVPETLHSIFVIELFLNNYIAGIVLELLNNCYRTVVQLFHSTMALGKSEQVRKQDIVEYPWGQCWTRPCGGFRQGRPPESQERGEENRPGEKT